MPVSLAFPITPTTNPNTLLFFMIGSIHHDKKPQRVKVFLINYWKKSCFKRFIHIPKKSI